jgi:hypothetical protein
VDAARHAALVAAGLQLFEDGLALQDSPALHAAMGRTLFVQAEIDPRFTAAAERVLGEPVEERALAELLASGPVGSDALLAAELHVRRGLAAVRRDGDRDAAARELSAAAAVLAPAIELLATAHPGIRDDAAAILAPLLDVLEGRLVPLPPSPPEGPP